MDIRKSFSLISLAGVISISAALGASKPSAKQVEEAKTTTEVNDVRIRREVASSGFDEFKKNTYREPFENGVYIVNGDTPIADDEELRDFYEMELLAAWKNSAFGLELNDALPALIADAPQGKVIAWDDVTKRNITYCVSTSFGGRYNIVVAAMAEAAKAWEDVSDVKFNHVAKLDQSCGRLRNSVVSKPAKPQFSGSTSSMTICVYSGRLPSTRSRVDVISATIWAFCSVVTPSRVIFTFT